MLQFLLLLWEEEAVCVKPKSLIQNYNGSFVTRAEKTAQLLPREKCVIYFHLHVV
jgi:hypothetical protein